MSNNSELTQNDKRNLERILSFGVKIAPPLPRPDNTKSVVQGSIKKRSDLDQLERILKLGLS